MKNFVLPDELRYSDPLKWLCRADEQGLFLKPHESPDALATRAARLELELREHLPADLPEVHSPVRENAEKITHDLYGFRTVWLPAYYSSGETGHFSAGVSVILDDLLPLVYLSGAFLNRRSFRGYTPEETLAHECVHAARTPFSGDSAYDEYFPCQVHSAKFRRFAGNFFRKWYIPAGFFMSLTFSVLCPFLLLISFLILMGECRLLLRIRRASRMLRSLGLRPEPVLIRLEDREIRDLARGLLPECIADKDSLRGKLFFRRFSLS